ncbi:acetyltransferase [Bacillus sp. JCM 19045]|nr:acetyltransferase [Bacillus sp. JCM 19045]
MEISKAAEMELPHILEHSRQAIYEGTLGDVMPSDDKVKALISPLLERGCYYLLAKEKETILGWVLIGKTTDSFTDQDHGFIYELYVLEAFRGKGIAKQLMQTAVQKFKEANYKQIRLSAYVENQAINLYKKLGFKERTVTMSLNL